MSKISIIVPIYKVEPYLKKCIESILIQSYTNLEIILVDDGSPDNCPEICDFYAERDSRIIVIHKENGGLSEARNYGLDIATGDYILFVDSDDYIREDMCEILLKNAVETNADMVVCDYHIVDRDYRLIDDTAKITPEIITCNDYIRRYIKSDSWVYVVAWNKLYKRYLFSYIRYPVGLNSEDEFIMFDLIYQCKKIVCIQDKLYYYFQSDNSITRRRFNAKHMDEAYALIAQNQFSKKIRNKELNDFTVNRLSNLLLKYDQYSDDPEVNKRYLELKRKLRYLAFEKAAWQEISFRGSLYYRLEILFPSTMNWVKRMYMKLLKR